MLLNQQEIDKAKHIVIVLPDNFSIDYLCSANALYTYLLQLHKKVSLYTSKVDFSSNLAFLPWVDKVKSIYPSSSDYEIHIFSSLKLFEYMQVNNIALNIKMATSLYAGLLDYSGGFSRGINGTIFAMAKVLIENKADVLSCNANLLYYQSLASLRLKSILLAKMQLQENATKAVFELEDEDLGKSGACIDDAKAVFADALGLPTVEIAVLRYKNEEIMKEAIS